MQPLLKKLAAATLAVPLAFGLMSSTAYADKIRIDLVKCFGTNQLKYFLQSN
jgi:hypothetical protein